MFNNFTRIHIALFSFLICDHFGQATGPNLLFLGLVHVGVGLGMFFFLCVCTRGGCFLIFL